MADPLGWIKTMWALVDGRLAAFAATLQRLVRVLRAVVFLLVVAIVLVLLSPVVLFLWPQYFPIAYTVAVVVLVIPVVALTVLVSLPLRLKSVIRLVDKGYPANAKEILIRVAARKLHEESSETVELLVETAMNEGRKAFRRYSDWKASAQPEPADDQGRPPNAPGGNPPGGNPPGAPPA